MSCKSIRPPLKLRMILWCETSVRFLLVFLVRRLASYLPRPTVFSASSSISFPGSAPDVVMRRIGIVAAPSANQHRVIAGTTMGVCLAGADGLYTNGIELAIQHVGGVRVALPDIIGE